MSASPLTAPAPEHPGRASQVIVPAAGDVWTARGTATRSSRRRRRPRLHGAAPEPAVVRTPMAVHTPAIAVTPADVRAPATALEAPPLEAPSRVRSLARFLGLVYLYVAGFLSLGVLTPFAVLGLQPFTVVSGSMAPALEPGSIVLVEPATPDGFLAPPTIVTFDDPARPGQRLTHRIVATEPVGDAVRYVTKGDANRVADSDPLDHADVTGAVRMVVPFVGLPATWVHDRSLLPLVLWLLASGLAVSSLTGRSRP